MLISETPLEASPRIGRFWFIGQESAGEPRSASILIASFESVEARRAAITEEDAEQMGGRHYSPVMFADEIWPYVRVHYPWVGYRSSDYYPGGQVIWSDDTKHATFVINPNLNDPRFIEVIAARFNVPPNTMEILETRSRAKARIGFPDPGAPQEPEIRLSSGLDTEDTTSAEKYIYADRARGTLLGLAIGDALGATLQFTRRDSTPVVRDLVGSGPFRLEPGQWTDDTSMALCLADSLIACPDFNRWDLMDRFVRWWRCGENSVTGTCFDIGKTTQKALALYERTGKTAREGSQDSKQAGSGSLKRLAPVVIAAVPDRSLATVLAELQSRLTHPAPIAHDACRFFAQLLVEAITGGSKDSVLRSRPWFGASEIRVIAAGEWEPKSRDEIYSSGYVVSTLEAALWCVAGTDSFEEALILAANLGDHSDTVAAVTGQLAGALYGMSGIPQRWLDNVAWKDQILDRANALLQGKTGIR
ncbi:ADP-ribosylglycohydrolase family protein [Microvirga yunnanensis]|uniref:ADP-ribosylglycohydrolase family protein n=1 Tax=Microvirga yunnanensis TaxID=2953740 RepID=UPI0021C9DFF9|nr:ADP-ribosylglycohydrolase family protein [Microvirga sp. HBU65207]